MLALIDRCLGDVLGTSGSLGGVPEEGVSVEPTSRGAALFAVRLIASAGASALRLDARKRSLEQAMILSQQTVELWQSCLEQQKTGREESWSLQNLELC